MMGVTEGRGGKFQEGGKRAFYFMTGISLDRFHFQDQGMRVDPGHGPVLFVAGESDAWVESHVLQDSGGSPPEIQKQGYGREQTTKGKSFRSLSWHRHIHLWDKIKLVCSNATVMYFRGIIFINKIVE